MKIIKQKITPNLWFDRQAEEAANFYTSSFKNSKVGQVIRATKAGYEIHGLPEGAVMTVEFIIEGQQFIAINGGPLFKFTPSVSFLVACETKSEVDALWEKLSAGGTALMELGEYPFSEKYGWTQDKYGLSWQVMHMGDRKIKQKITPTLMFVGEQGGKAETAIRLYTSVFNRAKIGDILRYGKGEEPDKEGTIKHAAFTLEGRSLRPWTAPGSTTLPSMRPFRLWCTARHKRRLTTTGRNSRQTEGKKACAAGSRISSVFPGESPQRAWMRC